MRKFSHLTRPLLVALMISLTVVACSKDKDDEEYEEDQNQAPPVINAITPAEVKIGGTFKISGTNLFNPVVEVATKVAKVENSTLTLVTAAIPSGIALGDASLRITTDQGTIVVSGLVIVP